ncbi:hypothetical protein FKM82_016077 [Ascaphus truei]
MCGAGNSTCPCRTASTALVLPSTGSHLLMLFARGLGGELGGHRVTVSSGSGRRCRRRAPGGAMVIR